MHHFLNLSGQCFLVVGNLLPYFSYDYPPKGRLIVAAKFVALLVFVGKAALQIAQVLSSETDTKQDAYLASLLIVQKFLSTDLGNTQQLFLVLN